MIVDCTLGKMMRGNDNTGFDINQHTPRHGWSPLSSLRWTLVEMVLLELTR